MSDKSQQRIRSFRIIRTGRRIIFGVGHSHPSMFLPAASSIEDVFLLCATRKCSSVKKNSVLLWGFKDDALLAFVAVPQHLLMDSSAYASIIYKKIIKRHHHLSVRCHTTMCFDCGNRVIINQMYHTTCRFLRLVVGYSVPQVCVCGNTREKKESHGKWHQTDAG